MQEALLEAHRQRGHFRGATEEARAAWLRRILAGKLADLVRRLFADKRDVGREQSLEAALVASSARIAAVLAADGSSPSARAEGHERAARLAEALATLPEAQREAVELRHCHGWSLDAIAAHLGRSPAAVAGLLKRGLRQLRERLTEPE